MSFFDVLKIYNFSQAPTSMSFFDVLQKIFDILAKVVQMIALGIGGWWVLCNYWRSRTHVARFELELDALVQKRGDQYYLLASIMVKNPSLRVVELITENSVLLISRLGISDEVTKIKSSAWDSPALVYAFDWKIHNAPPQAKTLEIEPGTTIRHQQLVLLPELVPYPQTNILLLTLRIEGRNKLEERKELKWCEWWRTEKTQEETRKVRATKVVMAGASLLSAKE